jgi:hypothetical protein
LVSKKNQNVNPHEANKIEKLEIIDINFLTADKSIFHSEYFEKGAKFYAELRKKYGLA